MPEGTEVRIISDFINIKSNNLVFKEIYDVKKGNIPEKINNIENFTIKSHSIGKQLFINLSNNDNNILLSVFMGMSGNWKFVKTENWIETKFTRLRIDSENGWSLLLYGGYMGPKFKIGHFTGSKRGPDISRNFSEFRVLVNNTLGSKDFSKPIGEALLNQKYFNGIGAYLNAEIIGRLDIDPFRTINDLDQSELNSLLDMSKTCLDESYHLGGGELKDWYNPFGRSKINQWIKFYGNKETCYRQKFGTRNIWIQKKFKPQ
jgi:endonuclease VIII-like 1